MRPPALPQRPAMFLVLLSINVTVYLLLLSTRDDGPEHALLDMIRWGANVAPLTLTGDASRLLTSMFLHAGWLHLALNMYMLLAFGGVVEQSFGALRFTLLYLLCGLFGGLLSALWHAGAADQATLVVSVGASGALMGIAGAGLGHWLAVARADDDGEARSVRRALLHTIGLTLLMGWLLPGVDNAAHIGGLLAGLVLGAVFALGSRLRQRLVRGMLLVLVCNIAIAILLVSLVLAPSARLLQVKGELLDEIAAAQSRQ